MPTLWHASSSLLRVGRVDVPLRRGVLVEQAPIGRFERQVQHVEAGLGDHLEKLHVDVEPAVP